MAMNFADAVTAYQKSARRDTLPGLKGTEETRGPAFADVLRDAAEGAMETLHEGERQSLQAAAGNADLTDVVTAVGKAELTLQTVVTLRDRVVQAYQDILRMPI